MFYTAQRTIYGNKYQLATSIGAPYIPIVNTTLNEKFNIAPQEPLPEGSRHVIKYIAIGVGGNATLPDIKEYPYSPHSPVDACLFEHIPFVLRPVKNDLYADERKQYRLRKNIQINGEDYVAYYLKVLNDNEIKYKDTYDLISRRGDVETVDPLNIEDKNPLNPTPISKMGKILASNSSYVVSTAKIIFQLTKEEIKDILDAIDILYASDENPRKVITEIAICHGVDKIINGNLESLQTQVQFFIGPNIDLLMELQDAEEVYRTYEIGGLEPLYTQ